MVGNPGVGKSTIASSICSIICEKYDVATEGLSFESGVSFGGGKTMKFDWKKLPDGNIIVDTPGLEDANTRKECGQEIRSALRHPINEIEGVCRYKILFICTLESGRIRPADIQMINTVTEALPGNTPYNMVVNKMVTKTLGKLVASQDAKIRLLKPLIHGFTYLPDTLSFVPFDENALDADDAILNGKVTLSSLRNPEQVLKIIRDDLTICGWLDEMSSCEYKVEDVKDLIIKDYQKRMDRIETLLSDLQKDNANLTQQLTLLTKKYEKQQSEEKKELQEEKREEKKKESSTRSSICILQ